MTKRRVLHIEAAAYPAETLATLEDHFDVVYASPRTRLELVTLLSQDRFDILIVALGIEIDMSVLSAAPNLGWVVSPTTGLSHIDLVGARSLGVEVISLQDARDSLVNVSATAEHTWALLLAVMRGIVPANKEVTNGFWNRVPFLGTELNGRTIGIVGYGRLGRFVGRYAAAFGMRVLAHDWDQSRLLECSGIEPRSGESLLAECDVLSLHLPLTPETRGWLSAERLETMRESAVIINTARGALLDEEAVALRLRAGRLWGVGVDVLRGEDGGVASGFLEESPLIRAARDGFNVVVTPHIGGWARDAVSGTRKAIVQVLLDQLAAKGGG